MSEGGGEYGGEIPEGDPNDVPDEISNEQPDEDPSELSNDDPFDEYPDEDPNAQPNDDPFDEFPDEDPNAQPNDDPFDEFPDEDPNAQPNDDPFDEFPDEDPNAQPNDDPFDEFPDEDPNAQPNDDPFDEFPDEDPDDHLNKDLFDEFPDEDPDDHLNKDPFDKFPDEDPDEHSNEDPFDKHPDEIVDEVQEELRGEEKNSEEFVEEINSSVESENIGTDQSTLILHQETQEPFSRDKEGNIILDSDLMEFFGVHVSSQEEMEVEILEEEMEKLFNSYEELGLEQEQRLANSIDLEQEKIQEQQELESEIYRQQQEEKTNQKMEQTQEQKLSQEPMQKSQKEISQTPKINSIKKMESIREQDEEENVQESSQKRIQEIKHKIAQEKEQPQEQSQEIEQESIQEAHRILKESGIKERYKQETGRRPIYAGKETKGFIEWKKYLKQPKEEQEEKNKLLHENEKETKEQSKEIREFKEEWAQYLANSIKESRLLEEEKEKLNNFLEKFKTLRELLEKLKTKEISEGEFKKELNKLGDILIEKISIARPLFMNFDWFRRYYNETIRKSGKRVAKFYVPKKTREFLSYISGRIEQLENIGNLHESAEKFEEFIEKSFQIKEEWALLLNNLIHEVPNKEISKEAKKELETVIKTYYEIRAILFNKNILEEDKEKFIQEHIEKCNPRFFELFEILKRFLGIYDTYSRNWMEQSLIIEGKKTIRQLSQKLENIDKESILHQIFIEETSSIQNLKEILKENLYKSTELRMSEKSNLIKIIQKKDLSEEDRRVIRSWLGSLSKRESITLLKNDFKNLFLQKSDQNEWKASGVNETRALKYSFNRNDNNATILIKIILNQIYENKRALEQYHFRQKEKNEFTFLKGKDIFYPQQEVFGSISLYNLGKFLGVSRSKARNWLIALDQNRIIKLPDLEFRKIRATILRFFQGAGGSIAKSRQIIKYALESYIDKCYNKMDFITKIVLLLDDCAIWEKIKQSKGDPHSLLSISKRMGMNRNYILEIIKRLKNAESSKYSKFFTLSTNILLLKYRSFKFKNKKNYEKFKTRALDIIFQEMLRQGIFSYENAELMRGQYNVLVYTLYALTKARNKRFSLLKLKPDRTGRNNKGIYTLSDLSRKIGGRKLLADYLLYETFISRETLAEIKNQLDEEKGYAPIECEFALNLLNEIPRIRLGQKPSYVGRRSHPILENFFRKLWLKLGIISKHEYQFNYPNSRHRIDSTLEVSTQQKLIDLLKSSSDSSLSKFKSLFIDYTIPNLVRFNTCVLDKISPEKKYLAKNRSVILVFYGIYSEKIFKTLQMKLNSLKLDYKKNIRFMDITKFIQIFTNNADELRELDEINTLIKNALDDDNEEALEELDRKADDALFDLSKYNK
jgi:hypothetical protein